MVSEVNKHLIIFGALQHWAACTCVPSEYLQEVLLVDIATLVTDFASFIDIWTVRLVEDLSLERIGARVGDVVVCQKDDLRLGNAILLCNLVGVACICLMTIVTIGVGPGNDNCPVVLSPWRWW